MNVTQPTEAQQQASRSNGTLSQGPVTDSGKQRSSQNARKHDFFTAITVLPDEDQANFASLLIDFIEEHKPATPTELRCIREMADAELRLRRVRRYAADAQCKHVDVNNLSHTPLSDAFQKLAASGPTLSLCLRYEKQFQRQFESALKMLFTLRKNAPKPQPAPAPAPAPTTKSADISDLAIRVRCLERMLMDPTYPNPPAHIPDEDDDLDLQNEPTEGL
jgi:hypothetical protein